MFYSSACLLGYHLLLIKEMLYNIIAVIDDIIAITLIS